MGLATTIAVIFHELPPEIGDYGFLIYAGFEKIRPLLLNFVAALSLIAGGIFAYFFLEMVETFSGTLIVFSAGAFFVSISLGAHTRAEEGATFLEVAYTVRDIPFWLWRKLVSRYNFSSSVGVQVQILLKKS
mgnify:CR=1 FL=1|tara:strand:- start:2232 stop:2627 length:396 start_codon:yes stop_codon:yes gene_type:complete